MDRGRIAGLAAALGLAASVGAVGTLAAGPIGWRFELWHFRVGFQTLMPWAAWIGTVFLLIQLGLHNEMTAMKAAGLPITTIVKPILFLGFLIGIFVFVVSEWIVPPSYSKAHKILDVYIDKNQTMKESLIYKNLTYNAGDRLLIYFKKFSPTKIVALEAIILKWDEALPNG